MLPLRHLPPHVQHAEASCPCPVRVLSASPLCPIRVRVGSGISRPHGQLCLHGTDRGTKAVTCTKCDTRRQQVGAWDHRSVAAGSSARTQKKAVWGHCRFCPAEAAGHSSTGQGHPSCSSGRRPTGPEDEKAEGSVGHGPSVPSAVSPRLGCRHRARVWPVEMR